MWHPIRLTWSGHLLICVGSATWCSRWENAQVRERLGVDTVPEKVLIILWRVAGGLNLRPASPRAGRDLTVTPDPGG